MQRVYLLLKGGDLSQTRNTRNATELPFLEISPKPTTFSVFGRGLATTDRLWLWGVSSTAGRRPETRTCTKPRLGRGLSTTDSFCGLEFRRGALWALHDGRLWPGIFAGAGRGTETRPCRAEIRSHPEVRPIGGSLRRTCGDPERQGRRSVTSLSSLRADCRSA